MLTTSIVKKEVSAPIGSSEDSIKVAILTERIANFTEKIAELKEINAKHAQENKELIRQNSKLENQVEVLQKENVFLKEHGSAVPLVINQ